MGSQNITAISKTAYQQAKAFFEPQLRALGLAEEQIKLYDLADLKASLLTVEQSIKSSKEFGTFRFSLSVSVPVVMVAGSSEAHSEVGILPILIERKNIIVSRIKAIEESQKQISGAYIDRDSVAFLESVTNSVVNNYSDIQVDPIQEETKESEENDKTKNKFNIIQVRAQIEQIKRLRGRLVELIPAEEALEALDKLRQPATIDSYIDKIDISIPLPFLNISSRLKIPRKTNSKRAELPKKEAANALLEELAEIEMRLSPSLNRGEELELKQHLSRIADQVSLRISRLTNLFRSLFNPAMSCDELIKNMVTKIGHKEYKNEAEMHLAVVTQLVDQLNQAPTKLVIEELDVLSGTTKAAVGVMTEIEERRLVVEKLVRQDRNQRRLTIFTVISYIALVVGLMISCILQGTRFQTGTVEMETLKLPLIGIPWPVIVWSLIGSFAAMIHRFNRMPIYDFSDAVKWLLTRPVQGAVLGSAFYLVLMAGLFLLASGATKDATGASKLKDEVVLILSFLVGFSDRFADSTFNALVETYSKDRSSREEIKER